MTFDSKVSVVTIVYNDRAGIRKTIESVLSQDQSVDEYIIIDGGSNDGTVSIINEYKDQLTAFISEPDKGIYDAMNKGWKLCKSSNFILFCNSSDHLEKNAIQSFSNSVNVDNGKSDIYHGILRFIKNGKALYLQGRTAEMLPTSMIEHPASFVRKHVFEELSGFDLHYRSASDYDFMVRAMQKKFKFAFMENIINNFDTSGVSSTSIRGLLESLKIKKKYNFISTAEYYTRYTNAKLIRLVKRALP